MKNASGLFILALFFAPSVWAQPQRAGTPPTPGSPNYGQQSVQAANSAMTNPTRSPSEGGDTMWERLLNTDNLSVDSENGVFQWRNNKFDIGNNLVVRSRFERYLASPGFGDNNDEYQAILSQIHDLLTVDNSEPTQGNKIYQAWQLLFKAAKYPQDGGASETLANQVFNAWRVRNELFNNKADYNDLEKERRKQEGTLRNDTEMVAVEVEQASGNIMSAANTGLIGGTGTMARSAKAGNTTAPASSQNAFNTDSNNNNNNANTAPGGLTQTSNTTTNSATNSPTVNGSIPDIPGLGPSGGGPSPTPTPTAGSLNGATKGTFDAMDLAKTYARQSLLDAEATAMGLQVKLQFQTQLFTYLIERRFQHSLIAGQFYDHIFKGSQQRILLGQQQLSRYISTDNAVPSVNSFEFLSREAITETDNTMKTVQASYNDGQRWTALQQLQQAFMLGEMLPSVQDFDPAKRKVLLVIYRESNDLRHLLDMRDYGTAEEIVKKIQAEAPDFNGAAIISAIQQGKQLSNLALMAAEQAAGRGDSANITSNLERAVALWPLNPEVDTFAKGSRDRANIISQSVPKFDELIARGDDRQIYEMRHELGLAVFKDPARSDKLKNIIDRMMQVEMSIAYAERALKQNNGYAAWEALADAATLEPDDPVLARAQREVSSRVPNFVAMLDSADRAQKSNDYAASLNYYLQAQEMYPASKLSHDGIDLTSKELMAKLNPGGTSAQVLATEKAAAVNDRPLGAAAATPAPGSDDASDTSANGSSPQKLF